ncbi:MAG: hypothetical protein SOH95_06650 [Bifidobacterium crudilactis]|jgi:hypothetical protein
MKEITESDITDSIVGRMITIRFADGGEYTDVLTEYTHFSSDGWSRISGEHQNRSYCSLTLSHDCKVYIDGDTRLFLHCPSDDGLGGGSND